MAQSITRATPIHDRLFGRATLTPSGCWEFQGAKSGSGYGALIYQGRQQRAHRVAYELLVGPIPDGLTIDHLCRNKVCINPAHLEPVTTQVNTARRIPGRSWNGSKTHCKQGHPFSPENTYVWQGRMRMCRTCLYARNERYRRAKRGQNKTPPINERSIHP